MAAKLRHALAQTVYLPRALRLVWAGAGVLNLVWAGLLVVQGLLPAVGLYLIRLLVDSFQMLPVGFEGLSADGMRRLALWASRLFAAGVLFSLPLVTALLLVNLGFGVASRAAPQLNIFSVGFPVSLGLGLFLIGITVPDVLGLFSGFLDEGYLLMSAILQ